MEKKLDLRVQKTRAALTSSLYSLLCEKGLNEITVTELCDRAMVRKATFYKHFADKSELLAYMIQDLQRVAYEQNTLGYDESVPMSFYTGVFRYFMDFLEGNERLRRLGHPLRADTAGHQPTHGVRERRDDSAVQRHAGRNVHGRHRQLRQMVDHAEEPT